jgi:hypothetical protein
VLSGVPEIRGVATGAIITHLERVGTADKIHGSFASLGRTMRIRSVASFIPVAAK